MLLNYTTQIEASKTVSQIEDILTQHGAKSILKNYTDTGLIESLTFLVNTPNGEAFIKLPVNPDAILIVMKKQRIPIRLQNKPQAIRVAWRIVKDWIEAQMAILETDMVKLDQIFLPYIEISQNKTVYQLFNERKNLQITQGEDK
jgi:hypothetical protein